ncbi:Extracellular metalloprotease [Beauveria bassiana D1-5]|uniref:Extracellular metalloprotease n=1 Tax=Beauveria bassiana D1-5 TaxID=1245745 RepID=A0A0A2VBR7_BEABA|nr:Extracellular metalloprotease [Beauveria bassiana D1-5]
MRSVVLYCFLGLLARETLVTALQVPRQNVVPLRESGEMENPPEELLALHKKFHDAALISTQVRRDNNNGVPDISKTINTPINIDVYVHVVTGTEEGQKRASDPIIQKQIGVLNDAFQGNFTFTLKDTDRKVNPVWAAGDDPDNMAASLHKGDAATWNLILVDTIKERDGSTTLGRSSNPLFAGGSRDVSQVNIDTLPGGSIPSFNLGKTAVHEAGHWVGLVHTFQGGCDGLGDGVDDTPAERIASDSCTPRDSCPDKPGLDPINNYMDYSPDSCLTNFTPGQFVRARQMWASKRARPVPGTPGSNDKSFRELEAEFCEENDLGVTMATCRLEIAKCAFENEDAKDFDVVIKCLKSRI